MTSDPTRTSPMPRLAERLGVGTMSLYRHVDDKDYLVKAVAEQVLSRVEVPAGAPDGWRVGSSVTCGTAGQRARSPALSRILADRGLTVGPVFDQLEQVRAILRAAGFSTTDAVRAFYTLLTYVFGFVMWELPHVHQQPAAYAGTWITALDHLDSDAYPTLHELRDTLTTTASSDQFEYGLAHLVGSLRPERGQRQRSSGS